MRFSPWIRGVAWLAAALLTTLLAALWTTPSLAQRPTLSKNVRQYVAIDTNVVALTHVRVIDGTGAPAREDQTLVLRDGVISAMGDAATVQVPAGAQIVDLTGRTVIRARDDARASVLSHGSGRVR